MPGRDVQVLALGSYSSTAFVASPPPTGMLPPTTSSLPLAAAATTRAYRATVMLAGSPGAATATSRPWRIGSPSDASRTVQTINSVACIERRCSLRSSPVIDHAQEVRVAFVPGWIQLAKVHQMHDHEQRA